MTKVIEKLDIPEYANVKVTKTGNQIEVQYLSSKNSSCPIRVLGNDEYLNLNTGEILKFENSNNGKRLDHIISLKRTFRNLRNIINTNITNIDNALWITLTYAENMQDEKRLYQDFKKFNMRFKYFLKKEFNISHYEYIVICEPQRRGAWHCHLLFIFDTYRPFIRNDIIAKLWKYGFTKTNSLKGNIDNIGAYLTAYLTDIEIDSNSENENLKIKELDILDDNNIKHKKKFIKGGRLSYYPLNFNIFRHSKGIKKPIIEYMPYFEILKKVGHRKPTFSKNFEIQTNNPNKPLLLRKEYYNLLRK